MQMGGWQARRMFGRYAATTEDDIVDAVRKQETDRKKREALQSNSGQSATKSNPVPTRVANPGWLN